MRYALRHWSGLIVFLDDGRVEMDTNVVECAIRPIPMTRKAALFAGSDGGAHHWAIAMTLIQTANLNGVEPMAYLTDVLERIVSGRAKAHELQSLLPWNWREPSRSHVALAATMIHNLEQAERLMDRLGAALPIPARLTREIQMTLRQQRGVTLPANCSVTWISYAGDDGGIVCRLEAAAETAEAVFASITHLRFDPRLPVTREIVAYQKHRVKRLRLQPQ